MNFYSRHIFPWVMDWVMSRRSCREQRPIVLATVQGEALEIGFGTGLNLPYYPPRVERLVVFEPNPGMFPCARRRIAASRLHVEWLALLDDRDLSAPDGSFDTVISTWTLCTIPDVAHALSEFHRVLKPGGRFLFIEHGLSPDPRIAHWQHRLNGINRRLGAGCNLNRDIATLIEASPLSLRSCERFYLPGALRIGGYTYRGVATR